MKSIALISCLLFTTALGARSRRGERAQQQKPQPQQNTAPVPAQGVPLAQEPHHRMLYENTDMRILDVSVPPHQSTLLEQHDYDTVSVVLANSSVTVQRLGQQPVQLTLPAGAVRYARAGFSDTLTNDGDQPFHSVAIEFLNTKLTASGCSCTGGETDAICSCPNARPLPANWERRIGQVTLAGVTLQPGATYDVNSQKTTRFLVAVTPLDVLNVSIHEPKNLDVRLPAGYFHWLAPGPNKVQNISSQPQRFVKVEFWGTPENQSQP
jgi:hypothetical protein